MLKEAQTTAVLVPTSTRDCPHIFILETKSNNGSKHINWAQLNRLRTFTKISDTYHLSLHPTLIAQRKRESRAKWWACKKRSAQIRLQFLTERAEFLAQKLRTTEEKALKAIIKSEQSRNNFKRINDVLGKQHTPLTQIDYGPDPELGISSITSFSSKEDVEKHILLRNKKYSLQSLSTPFFNEPLLLNTIHPNIDDNKIQKMIMGNFLHDKDVS
jgi:hypothetical protein